MRFAYRPNSGSPAYDEINAAVKAEINAAEREHDELSFMIAKHLGIITHSSPALPQKSFFLGYNNEYSSEEYRSYLPEYLNRVVESYANRWASQRNDFTGKVPFKTVKKEPKNFMGGVLGYTVLNEGWIVLRDDLEAEMKQMVDVHESIHTPDEYETRVITAWMLSNDKPRYEQY